MGPVEEGREMTITAKYASKCSVCGSWIQVGTPCDWAKGSPAVHPLCAPRRQAVAASPARRREPMGSGHGQAAAVRGYSSYCTANASCGCYDCAS